MQRSIVVTVGPQGQTRVEAMGFSGQGCKALTDAMGAAVGRPIESAVKPEFYDVLPEMPAVAEIQQPS